MSETMKDILIIGNGPAGLSAAVNARARDCSVLVIGGAPEANPLYKAERIDNYSGLYGISGAEMLTRMRAEADQMGAEFRQGRVTTVLPMGDHVAAALGTEIVQGRALILATGVVRARSLENEERLLGKGVSYCATCDGMLYRGKQAVVMGDAEELVEEARFLHGIGVQVTVLLKANQSEQRAALAEELPVKTVHTVSIVGETAVEAVEADGKTIPCQAVFLLRKTLAPDKLLAGLALDGRSIRVDALGRTNIDRIYAAGDCTGWPLQIAKAVGDGLKVAQQAAKTLKAEQKG